MRRSKFNAVRTEYDGRKFDSKGECERYKVLREREERGEIVGLKCQISFPLIVNGERIARYVADFSYERDGVTIVEDFKSPITAKTATFAMKRKLMKAIHGIDIHISMKANDP